jgi:hypothetical protein
MLELDAASRRQDLPWDEDEHCSIIVSSSEPRQKGKNSARFRRLSNPHIGSNPALAACSISESPILTSKH